MLIDCETCAAPENACADCVITVLLRRPRHEPPEPLELDDTERFAIGNLARVGLTPPLRLVSGLSITARDDT